MTQNVCKNNIEKAGPTTAFAQQWKILRLSGQTLPNPRKQLVKDLCKQMDEWRDRKCSFFCNNNKCGANRIMIINILTHPMLLRTASAHHVRRCDSGVPPGGKGSTEAKRKKNGLPGCKKMFGIGEPRNEGKLLWAGIMLPTSETGCVCGLR
jgi:hypothetical protein